MVVFYIVLSVVYATYVITRSDFPAAMWLRDWVFDRWGEGTWQSYLVSCTWCVGFYVSLVAVLGTDVFTEIQVPALSVLTCAALNGIIMQLLDLVWTVHDD